MKTNIYLNFDGTCEEAFNFYKSIFGGQFTDINRFKDMPATEQPLPESEGNRIMHMGLPIGEGMILMGSDISPAMGHKLTLGNNISVSLHPDSKEETDRLYKSLSDGGKIEMPLEKMFWGAYFAGFTDKYGIPWMINFEIK